MHEPRWEQRRWRRGRRAMALVGVAAGLTMAVSACGSSDDSSDTSTGGGGASTAAASDGPVNATVGLLVPLTGELGDFGQDWADAGNLAVKEINATGLLPGGGQMKTVVADGKTNAQVGVSEARKMISTQNVSAIVGPTSEIMVAVAPIAKREQIPVISGAAGTIQLNDLGGDFVYRTVASDLGDGFALAKYLHTQNPQNVVMLVENQGSLPSIAATIKKSFEDQGGKVAKEVTFNPGQSSYRTEVGSVLDANPDWIVCACGQQSGVSIIKETHASGYKGHWLVSSDLSTPESIKAVGQDIMQGVVSESPSTDQSSSAYKRYAAATKEAYGHNPGLLVANVYDAMNLVGLAIVKSGSSEGSAINDALRDVAGPPGVKVETFEEGAKALKAGKDIDYVGASGPVDFDDTGTVASSYTILQVDGDAWKQIEFYPATDMETGG
jgi:branched-chain amino acid transport system substrate-binding protein/neutral amino acid transport system substrate-binding protein